MAHEISLLDQVVTQSGTDRAWHLLDKQFELNGLTDSELSERTGLDFEVSCFPMGRIVNAEFTRTPDLFGVFSSKNPEMFTTLSELTVLVQPSEVAAFGNKIAEGLNGKIVSAGTIKGTRLAWVSIDLGKKIELPGGDTLKQYLTVTISFDGSYRFAVNLMDYRTVCNNTFPSPECSVLWEGRKEHGFGLLPVDRGFDPEQVAELVADSYHSRIEENKQKYQDVIGKLADTHFDGARDKNLLRFASIMADGKQTLSRIISLSDDDQQGSFLDRCLTATVDRDAWDKVRTQGLNNVGARIVAETLDGLGSDLESAKGTLWGALNGFTYYTDHLAGRLPGQGKKASDDSIKENNLFGSWNQQKENAVLLLSAIANTPEVR